MTCFPLPRIFMHGLQKSFVIKSIFFLCLTSVCSDHCLAVQKSDKTPRVIGMFWTTGYEDLLEEMNEKETQTLLASPQLPSVDIGGEKFGSKRTFQAIRKFLEQKKNTSDILSFTIDHLTYWSNKKQFDQLCADYPERFRLSFFKDFLQSPEIQKHSKILPFLNTALRLMPVLASDLFRLLAPCAPEALNVDPAITKNPWSWIYIDVDQMINAQETGENSALDKLISQSNHKSTQLFLNGSKKKIINNEPLRIDVKANPVKLKKFQNHILSVSPPLNNFSNSLSYFDNLVEMVKSTPTVEKYTNLYNIQQRQKIYDPINVILTTGRGLLAKLRTILPTEHVKFPKSPLALEWTCGASVRRERLEKEALTRVYMDKNPHFIDNYLESAGVMNDLLKFSKVQKWLSWQNSYGKGLAYTDNLKKLIGIAFERLIQINPFPTENFEKCSKKTLDRDKKIREKRYVPHTAISAMLTWGNRLTTAYPDHLLLHKYRKINKVFKFRPEYNL